MALQTLPASIRERQELVVVGHLPPSRDYDPVGRARALGVADRVQFFDYVEGRHFDGLFQTCDAILNLRYPLLRRGERHLGAG